MKEPLKKRIPQDSLGKTSRKEGLGLILMAVVWPLVWEALSHGGGVGGRGRAVPLGSATVLIALRG